MAIQGPGFSPQEINLFVNVDDRGTAQKTQRNMQALFSTFERQKEMGKEMNPYPEMMNGMGGVAKANQEMMVGFRGFRMELLSVMFFGMALNKVFGDHVQRVNDMIGVTAIWNAVAEDMLIDVMLPLSDAQFALADAMMNLPGPIKNIVGGMMLVVTQGGMLLMSFGQIALGLDGLAKAFPRSTGLINTFRNAASKMWNVMVNFAGKTFSTATYFVTRGWKGTNGLEGVFAKVKSWKGKVIPVTIAITATLIAFELGKGLGQWLNKNVTEKLFGTDIPMRNVFAAEHEKGFGRLASQSGINLLLMELLGMGGSMIPHIRQNDFVMRPGQAPVPFSSTDTIVGTQGGAGQSVVNNINIDAKVSSDYDVRELGGRLAEVQTMELNSRSLS